MHCVCLLFVHCQCVGALPVSRWPATAHMSERCWMRVERRQLMEQPTSDKRYVMVNDC